ncbi:MAG: zf-HC2 domain-containing protein [Acidobacteriota bacterium]|nr:zf-HC2 domain-containing protein [Acidobacteriota bacterium]
MKCKKIKRLLPLYAGNDLSLRMASAVKSHLSSCPECRREYKVYIQSLQEIKEWLKSERIDWDEAEWQQSVKRAAAGKIVQKKTLAPWPFKPVWALGFMTVILIVISIFWLGPSLFRERSGLQPDTAVIKQTSSQEIVEMILVSRETGFKVKWFLNKNFNLEEETE